MESLSSTILSDTTYIRSPFLYLNGQCISCENVKNNCTYEELHTFTYKNFLTQTDWEIINSLYEYQFLNKHLLLILITELRENKLKKKLKKLITQGIILKLKFSSEQDNNGCYIYTLSKGAFQFMKKRFQGYSIYSKLVREFNLPAAHTLLNQLIFNQFDIMMKHSYSNFIHKIRYFEAITMDNQTHYINGIYTLNYLDNKKSITIAVNSLRRTDNWRNDLINIIKSHIIYSRKHPYRYQNAIPVIICEDDIQVKEAFLYKESLTTTKNSLILFTTDMAIIMHKILEYLYHCELVSDYQILTDLNGASSIIIDDSMLLEQDLQLEDQIKLQIKSLDLNT